MASRLKNMIRLLGWKDGLSFYMKSKSGKFGELNAGKWNTSFHLRPNTTDFDTYEHVFVLKEYELELPFQPKLILDGGANIGMSAIYFSLRYPNATIISVEPDKDNFELLKHNTRHFPNVKPVCKGIWNESGYLEIIDTGAGANAFMVQKVDKPGNNTIPAVAIGDLLQEYGGGHFDIVKLDIEGAEKAVFSDNVDNWLPKTKLLIIELHDRMQPGSSKALFNAVNRFDFSCETKWENLLFFNNKLN